MKQLNINLLTKQKNKFKKEKIGFILSALGISLISLASLVFLNFFFSYQVKYLRNEKENLLSQLASFSVSLKKKFKLKQQIEELNNSFRKVRGNHQQIRKILEILDDITLFFPVGFSVKYITYDAQSLKIVSLPLQERKFLELRNKLYAKYHQKIKCNYKLNEYVTIEFSI